jgi:hypothetical protein
MRQTSEFVAVVFINERPRCTVANSLPALLFQSISVFGRDLLVTDQLARTDKIARVQATLTNE